MFIVTVLEYLILTEKDIADQIKDKSDYLPRYEQRNSSHHHSNYKEKQKTNDWPHDYLVVIDLYCIVTLIRILLLS